jgi:hypothetical protein
MQFTVMLSPDARNYRDSLDDKRAGNIYSHKFHSKLITDRPKYLLIFGKN